MRGRMLGLFAAVMALGLVAAACSSDGGSEEKGEGGTITVGSDEFSDHGSKDVSGTDEIDLEADNDGSDFYFEPTVLQGEPGQTLKIDVENEGDVAHNFTIDDQNIDVDIQPGEKQEATVTFPESGTVAFYCEFHESQGMGGALSVS